MTKKNKAERIKVGKYRTEEQDEIIRFIKILVIVVVLIVGVYFLTRIFVTKDLFNKDSEVNTVTPGKINYETTIIGSMFNKPEKEYYVIMYSTEDLNAVYYSGLIANYQKNTKFLKVYYADLNNELNKKYVDATNENVDVSDLKSFKVGDLALIKVINGKITKALTDEEAIAKELEYVKSTNS